MGVLRVSDDPALRGLTDRQAVFALEYLTDLNQTRAARDAGYAHPNSMSAKLLANPKVATAVRRLAEPRLKAAGLSADRVLCQLHNFLFADPAAFFDHDGSVTANLAMAPEALRQSVEALEIDTSYDRGGRPRKQRVRLRLVSKAKAMEAAMKYLSIGRGRMGVGSNRGITTPAINKRTIEV